MHARASCIRYSNQIKEHYVSLKVCLIINITVWVYTEAITSLIDWVVGGACIGGMDEAKLWDAFS